MKEFHYALGFYSLGKNRKKKKKYCTQIAEQLKKINTTFNSTKSTPMLKSDPSDESSLQVKVWMQEGLYVTSSV